MGKRSENKTKNKIALAAWKLFNENGYEATTVEEIIEAAGTSRGTFYHYYDGKDALIASMVFVLDEEYEKIYQKMNDSWNSFEKLMYLDIEMCRFIENKFSADMTSQIFGSQLTVRGSKSLLARNRSFYRIIRKILDEGQSNGEISSKFTVNEILNNYAILERGIIYDWCMCNGEYNLSPYARQVMPLYMKPFFLVPCNLDFRY